MNNKVSFHNMKLKLKDETVTVKFQNSDIEILKYLPSEKKYDLLETTLSESREGNVFNEYLMEIYFSLNIIYLYTNISFTDNQKEDPFKLYDLLEQNGLFDLVFNTIDPKEYQFLRENLLKMVEKKEKYYCSISSCMEFIINQLPINAADAVKMVENFDKEKYQEVINFANAIGMSNK